MNSVTRHLILWGDGFKCTLEIYEHKKCHQSTAFLTPINDGGGGGSGGQAAINNHMIASRGMAYVAAENTILQVNYLWPHKGNGQCAVLYLSTLALMFSCHRKRSHDGMNPV